jgi:hypothetical protein
MPSRNETIRAFERLRLATPICDDESLANLEEDVAEYRRTAAIRRTAGAGGVGSPMFQTRATKLKRAGEGGAILLCGRPDRGKPHWYAFGCADKSGGNSCY